MTVMFTRGENPLKADKLNSAFSERVARSGDTMQGRLNLFADPVAPFEAATKQYVDRFTSVGVPTGAYIGAAPPGNVLAPLWWDTNTGQLFIQYNDGSSTQWVSANSIDASSLAGSFLPLTGGSLSGPLLLAADPVAALHPVTLQYFSAQLTHYLPLTGGVLGDTLQVGTLTGNPPPVASLTSSGRTWLGAATARTGNVTWVASHTDMTYFDTLSQLEVISQPGSGGLAIVAAGRSSDTVVPSSPTFGAIGFGSFVVNDDAVSSPHKQCWNAYFHYERNAGTGSVIGLEIDGANLGDAQNVNSYSVSNGGITAALWLGSGGETADGHPGIVNPMSCYIGLINNGAAPGGADKGIVFVAGSVVGSSQVNPVPSTAIQMSKSMQVEWLYGGSDTVGSFIRSDVAGPNTSILFHNSKGFTIVDTATETTRFSVSAAGATASPGTFTVGTDTAGASVVLNSQAGSNIRNIQFRTASLFRWVLSVNGTAESGANAGSDLQLSRYDDAGSPLPIPMTISRATGQMSLSSALLATAGISLGTDTAPSVLVNNGPVNSQRFVRFSTANSTRWNVGAQNGAESGGNVGSDYVWNRYNDSAGFIDSPLTISRATGQLTASVGIVSTFFRVTSASGPTWTSGTGAPVSVTQPIGSLYSRTDGAVGSTIYVSRGATWVAIAGV